MCVIGKSAPAVPGKPASTRELGHVVWQPHEARERWGSGTRRRGAGCSSLHAAGFRPRRKLGPYLHSIMLDILGQQLPRFLLSFSVCTVPCPGIGKPQSDLLYLSKQWLPLGTELNSPETLEKARKVHRVVYDGCEPNTGTLVTE